MHAVKYGVNIYEETAQVPNCQQSLFCYRSFEYKKAYLKYDCHIRIQTKIF